MTTEVERKCYVLYHADCYDGFGAAWAAWRYLGNRPTYIPVQHGKPLPEIEDDARVYILDFSYPRDVLEALDERTMLTVIDHHKTAQDALADLPYATFDLGHSGAVLAWHNFHTGPAPELLRYVEDRDLWRWELVWSREVSAALRSHPMDFEVWSRLNVEGLAAEGKAILRFTNVEVDRTCKNARVEEFEGHRVPVGNATSFVSEVGQRLLQLHPYSPFSMTFFVREDGRRVYSLRSRGDFDVSEVATRHGGGGHPAAAGFVFLMEDDCQ